MPGDEPVSTYRKDLSSTLLNQLCRVISGPLVLLCIPLCLTPVSQGYWYTFSSIAALAVFADLGFSTIILQFSAHEFAFLKFTTEYTIVGDEEHLWKLASFFRFSVTWVLRASTIAFPIIVIGGYIFLANKNENIPWQGAWILYSVASGFAFFNGTLMCFFEGCNSVSLMQRIRFCIALACTCVTLGGLFLHLDLFTLGFALLVNVLLGSFYLLNHFSRAIRQLWEDSRGKIYNWWPEFSNLIWRYAISWCSGYFIFQLFTPLAFNYYGSVLAGKIGISIAMWTAGYSIATSWLTAVTPRLNMMVEKHNWHELDRLFNKSLLCAMGTMVMGGVAFFVIDSMLTEKFYFFDRILNFQGMFILFLCWLCQTYVNGIAVYLRAHKKEPMMIPSILSAIHIAITTFLCAKFLPIDWLFCGFLSSFVWEIPVVIWIFKTYKKIHEKEK